MRVLYDLTYATRGNSGIPKDTRDVGQILINSDQIEVDFILNSYSYVERGNREKDFWIERQIGSSLRGNSKRELLPPLVLNFLIAIQSLSIFRRVKTRTVEPRQAENILTFLNLKNLRLNGQNPSVSFFVISYFARFVRPRNRRLFRLDTPGYDFFVQQQVDPIEAKGKTIHIVRLHDFLPISHPQYFDAVAVQAFAKSLEVMLKHGDKVFVFDTESTANEFRERFGKNLDVRSIPCVIESVDVGMKTKISRRNQICVVNTLEPRKRVSLAIDGFLLGKIKGDIPLDWELHIVGKEGWLQKDLVEKLKKGWFGDDVVYHGEVTSLQLDRIYLESKIVLSTTAAEGFGLPPLEGMARGCLPVISNITQHLETIGDLGIYFQGQDPISVSMALSEAISLLSENPENLPTELRNHVVERFSEKVISKKWAELLKSLKPL